MTRPHTSQLVRLSLLLAPLAVTAALAQTPPPPAVLPDPPPSAPSDAQTSFELGLGFGEQMHFYGVTQELDVDAMLRGFKEGLAGRQSTPEERQRVQEFIHTVMVTATARNRAAAQAFLARNAHEKGVKTLPSGLQYKVLAAGDSKAPTVGPADEATVNYRGTLLNGSEFDSSYARGTPAKITVTGVIEGWKQVLALMHPGAHFQVFVPPDLGYSDSARPGIPGGSLLLFDIDLIGVKVGGAPQPHPLPLRPLQNGVPTPQNQ